jgi:hypothetical protein
LIRNDCCRPITRLTTTGAHIFELDNATKARLRAEQNLSLGISQRQLVFHLPNHRVINAAFTHLNPAGARYAAFELATAKAEVIFHKSIEFAEIDWKEREEIGYDAYLADFPAAFHDLRGVVDEGRWYLYRLFSPSVVAKVRKSTGYRLIWTPLRARFVRQESQPG